MGLRSSDDTGQFYGVGSFSEAYADKQRIAELERQLRARAEICICAAIRLPDGRVIRGHRHGDCIRTAHELVEHQAPGTWSASMCRDQGFVTSWNRYVGREEGLRLQKAAGIPSARPDDYHVRDLFSEDLY